MKKYHEKKITTLIGDDPGAKVMVAATRLDIETGKETSYRLTTKQWHRRVGYYERRRRLFHVTGQFERQCRDRRENEYDEMPSCKSTDYMTYIRYQLDVFVESCKLKHKRYISKLKFDKYTRTQKELHVVARELTGLPKEIDREEQTMILALGNAKIAANSIIEGSLRTPRRGLEMVLQRYAMIVAIDEFRTSMLCSRCKCMLRRPTYKNPEHRNRKDR